MESATADAGALDELVRRGLPLVQVVVSELMARVPRHLRRDDLVSAGMLGLTQAAAAWDPDRGTAFETFARNRVRGALLDELRQLDWASRSVRSDARRMHAATLALTNEMGRQPTRAEIADRLGTSPAAVERIQHDVARADMTSFDAALELNPGAEPASPDEEADAVLQAELRAVLGDAVDALPDRLRYVVTQYFLLERPMLEIAGELGVTESRISQMRAEALALLRDGIDSQLDPERVGDLGRNRGRVGRRKNAYYAAVAAARPRRSA